jgi:hypothetical protein
VWLLGCGEKIKKDSVYKIIKIIETQEFDVAVLNFDIYSENKGIIENK